MNIEIERKFLVAGDFGGSSCTSHRIIQGYLSASASCTIRVRTYNNSGYLTIKSASDDRGWSRHEFEYTIPLSDAESLLKLCVSGVIDKTRYLVPVGVHTWEVDVFHGSNEGLIIAELELTSEDEGFERPAWLGEEVTGDVRYYNAMLSQHPFTSW
jgi:CYTH domain-containing protein